jgi:hypothetical protein
MDMKIGFISFLVFLSSAGIYGQTFMNALNDRIFTDTVNMVSSNVPVPSGGYITFASAFRWNRTGPTGGFWSENYTDDHTFRPVFENVAAYNLKIYNRFGYMVFESSDLHKGWDGYLINGSLASQGVYIWKVSGKFNDGTAFRKAGDVTFIY